MLLLNYHPISAHILTDLQIAPDFVPLHTLHTETRGAVIAVGLASEAFVEVDIQVLTYFALCDYYRREDALHENLAEVVAILADTALEQWDVDCGRRTLCAYPSIDELITCAVQLAATAIIHIPFSTDTPAPRIHHI